MNELQLRTKRILVEAMDGEIGLWQIRRDAEDTPPLAVDAKDEVIATVRTLLIRDLIEIGDLDRVSCFYPWPGGIEESVTRILVEWANLGREPTIYDICWVKLTDKGMALGRSLLDSGEDLGFEDE